MRRPKQPNDNEPEHKPPPGGHARKRVEQFNRQRGLPADSISSSDKDETKDTQESPKVPGKRDD